MFFKVKMLPINGAGPLYEYLIIEGGDWVEAEERACSLPYLFGQPSNATDDAPHEEVKKPLNEQWPVLTANFFEFVA